MSLRGQDYGCQVCPHSRGCLLCPLRSLTCLPIVFILYFITGYCQWPALAAAVPLTSALVTPPPHCRTLANTCARRSASGCLPWFLELSPHLFALLTLCSTAGSGLEIPDPPGSGGSTRHQSQHLEGKARATQRNPVLNHYQHHHHSLKKTKWKIQD